jgi:hypothetical protein
MEGGSGCRCSFWAVHKNRSFGWWRARERTRSESVNVVTLRGELALTDCKVTVILCTILSIICTKENVELGQQFMLLYLIKEQGEYSHHISQCLPKPFQGYGSECGVTNDWTSVMMNGPWVNVRGQPDVELQG